MRLIRHFKCQETEVVFERMVDSSVTVTKCKCGAEAEKCISAPRYYGNSVGKSPARNY